MLALAVALAVVIATFGIAAHRRRYDTIDSVWGLGFVVITGAGLLAAERPAPSAVITALLTAVWGLRLSWHILLRGRSKPEDPRYQAILDRAGSRPRLRMFVRVYLAQALVMWFVSLPVQAAQLELGGPSTPWFVLWVGTTLWTVGMFFEVIGDAQLRRFRADPANAGKVLDRGLWRFTRHPNYFGDACVWWGLYLAAAHQAVVLATVLSPLLMTWLLARGSGKPVLERHMRRTRPEYADYVERTSGFFPLPPKRR
ncbi:DUF1295 domain-containing protein [Saccharopolyspora spinosa]|uniref:Steroid 5-alpha reductase family enzyme n=1 Tax=Saccharopolyspora spinosa TaxID=60894 RepID=A0A2N3XV96_SACSN|nr:DUF1295 domain-containing protein [Saccharopolyspora spinosa]PKW14597.1 steroid 5-alpha reductase family enzyme [Saccharopolyspora spinosa]